MPLYPFSVDGDIDVPADAIPANLLVGPLPTLYKQTVLLASLQSGSWFPNEYIGPSFLYSSSIAPYGYSPVGSGFYRVVSSGFLTNFRWTITSTPGSNIDAEIYIASGGNPALFSPTGVIITMIAGNYIANNDTDSIYVNADDIIVLYNPSISLGFTPNSMRITAQFSPI